jgi:phosphoribosyl 1,2-cyclic phosphate phosphodiesterase
MSIEEAVAAGKEIAAARVWLTHLTHLTDHGSVEATLPVGFGLAFDGLRILL